MGLFFQNLSLCRSTKRADSIESILFSQVDQFAFMDPGGRLETRSISFSQRNLKIGRVQSTGHRIALTEENAVTFLLPQQGGIEVSTGRRRWTAGMGDMLALRPGRRDTSVHRSAQGDTPRAYFLILPYADLLAIGSGGRDAESLFKGGLGTDLHNPAALRLRNYLGFAVEDLIATPSAQITDRMVHGLQTLIEDLLHDLLDATSAEAKRDVPDVADSRATRARLALDILHARADEPLSIAELAKELGIGIRSLQMLFLKTYGVGPREMLNRIRLDMVRKRLLLAEPDAQVTMIALDSGFTHLGRFSEAYRRTFGERPVDTLRRKRPH